MPKRRRFWEEPDFAGDSSSDSSEEDQFNQSQPRAGRELVDLLIYLRLAGKLSARVVCVLAWWAHRAGACGGVAELGKHPYLRSTGQYQRHFDAHVNFTTGRRRQAKLKVPGHAPHFNRRVLHEIAVRPPHEALHDELVGDENAEVVLREALHERSLPPSYWQHPIVRKSAVPVWPVAFSLTGCPPPKKTA